ncbi:MAG TPA: tetratricopeptide repeat protein [Planctomycetaceae bacterium]|jgi:tetratricopeptide (TPR) repeat protein|nr:tetratricopeptide repeat protein [Planctomycetaceae bacterium]
MIPEASASGFRDQSWELQRSWDTKSDGRVGNRLRFAGLALLLAVATLLVYAQACQFGFALFDDSLYFTENAHVQAGLSVRNVAWSFTTFHDGNWVPLTWLSLMADNDLFSGHPGGFHFTNIVLHTLNTVLLFAFLTLATGRMGPSALVAGLFALHPLHVESVVWIAERKDVLSTLFGLIALLAYVRYTRHRNSTNYCVVMAFFVCSLLAKQTLVTLPCVFLLLDYWPLNRFSLTQPPAHSPEKLEAAREAAPGTSSTQRSTAMRLLLEKVPFLLVSLGFSVVIVLAQVKKEAVQDFHMMPLTTRLANAAVVYVAYLEKTFYPHNLAVYYPHPGNQLSSLAVFEAVVLLAAISACAVFWSRRHPYFFVGWAWYLGTLVPMIGIVQVGAQQMADRYTYFPLIGVFFGLVWTIRSFVSPFASAGTLRARALNVVAVAGLVVLGAMTFSQLSYWRDDVTLFTHDLASTADCAFMRNKLGCALAAAGKPQEGIKQFELAIRLDPKAVDPQYNLGVAMTQLGQFDQAMAHYRAVLEISESHGGAHNNLALLQNERGQYTAAKTHLRRAVELSPDWAQASMNLGLVCFNSGDYAGAISNSQRALELEPRLFDCDRIIARALEAQGRPDEAISRLQQALTISPENEGARMELARLLAAKRNSPLNLK